jgi:hypothetical protein
MDSSVNVVVDWCPEKRENLPLSGVYSTVAKFAEDAEQWPREAWSIVLEFSPAGTSSDGRRVARARFLSDTAPTERLRSGRTFELYEGSKKTATVTVA